MAWGHRVVGKMPDWIERLRSASGSKNVQLLTCGDEIELFVGVNAMRD